MRTIMAGGTIIGDARVTENRWRECRGVVAKLAILIRRQMVRCQRFRRGEAAVMTTFAAGGDVRVNRAEKYRRRKRGGGVMTHIAIIQGRNMVKLFAGSGHFVMAEGAVADNARMVKYHRGKSARTGMTKRAVLCCQQVIGRHACRDQTVVTRRTIVDDTGMIKHTRGKVSGGMANATVFRGWQMVYRFAARADDARTVVAGRAGLYREVDAGVVKHLPLREAPGVMAPTAIVDSGRVGIGFAC